MKIRILLPLFLLINGIGFAQFTMNTSNFSANGTTVSVVGDLNFNSTNTTGNAILVLSGSNDQNITTAIPRTIPQLVIGGRGNKTFSGEFEVTQNLTLDSGLVVPDLIFGVVAGATINELNPGVSYVAGTLFRGHTDGDGTLHYPIGTTSAYTPVEVDAVGTAAVGITPLNSAASGVSLPVSVPEYSNNWRWILTAKGGFSTALVTLPFMVDDRNQFGADGYRPIVLHNEVGQATANLLNADMNASSASEVVTALAPGGVGSYFVGKELLFDPKINNVITPDGNGINDYLTVQNLSLYPINHIKLIDKYGAVVFEAKDYVSPLPDSAPGEGENFDFLAAGNYFCVLKYTDPVSGTEMKLEKTVTVLY